MVPSSIRGQVVLQEQFIQFRLNYLLDFKKESFCVWLMFLASDGHDNITWAIVSAEGSQSGKGILDNVAPQAWKRGYSVGVNRP